VTMRIEAHQPEVTIAPFKNEARTGVFTSERVWIEQGGDIISERRAPRDAFAGHVRATPWDELHELYFTGYAFWNYFNTPFLLAGNGIAVAEAGTHYENNDVWRRLQVRFPPGFPTHSAEQTFYFNDRGLLQRLDYVTDVAGGVAAHYCYDHTAFDGLIFPTLRRVVRRIASEAELSGPTAVLVVVEAVRVI
jgi:hypothetical protein